MTERSLRVRTPDHARFAARLRESMTKRGYIQKTLGARLGVTQTMVGYWCRGIYLPPLPIVERMSEILDDLWLLRLVMAARTVRCPGCGTTFDRGQTRRQYCNALCQRAAHLKGGKRPADPRQEAIDAMCRGCEPEGTCRDDSCALRPFSPLLFVPLHRLSVA